MGDIQATGWTFAQIPIWILCNDRISDGAKTLFAYLKWRQGTDTACWPSKATMAYDLGVHTNTIERRLNELQESGYLVKHLRSGQTTLYEMVAQPAGEKESFDQKQKERKAELHPPAKMPPPSPAKMPPPPPRKNGAHDDTKEQESLTDSDCATAQPPSFFPDQFSTSVSAIKEKKFVRSEWEQILEAENARGENARSSLVKWLESKLHGGAHPAIQAYLQEMGKYPRKNQFQEIIETVGENGGPEFFGQIVHAWKMHGWSPFNVAGMLDCFKRREIPGKQRGRSGPTQHRPSHPPPDPREVERAAKLTAALQALELNR